jgi:release factor glutamine methyltransferase
LDGSSDTPRLDAQVLLAFLLGVDRTWIILNPDAPITDAVSAEFNNLLQRRLAGECIAYLVGSKEFFGHSILVGPGVLVPRPETEILVEWILADWPDEPLDYLDTCTGSACIPLSIAHYRPQWRIRARDISTDALFWAKKNIALAQSPSIQLEIGDLLSNIIPASLNIISANPPYVPRLESQAKAKLGWTEPQMALDGGNDGLDFYRQILPQAQLALRKEGYLYLEFGDNQAEQIRTLGHAYGFESIEIRSDLANLPRIARLGCTKFK